MVRHLVSVFIVAAAVGLSAPAQAAVTAFKQAVAEAVAGETDLAAFYRDRGFAPIWTGADDDDLRRRAALLEALSDVDLHGLPEGAYSAAEVRQILGEVSTERERGRAEIALSRIFVEYATDLTSGLLDPGRVESGIKREPERPDAGTLMSRIASQAPGEVFADLVPASPEYSRLLAAKLRLEEVIAAGGWGPDVAADRLGLGDSGAGVVALRNRLVRMGYMPRNVRPDFDLALQEAVKRFQAAHGLVVDGVFGPSTAGALNVGPEERLGQVLVALERERWMNFDRGERHVWVNLADFSAAIVDDGKVTFKTKAVVGAEPRDRRSPEFSDEMEHMVVNPTWHVPRSIAVNEYLPQFKRNPASNGQLQIIYKGQAISRDRINWPAVTAQNFPFALKEPPSQSNALGLVKFMFPNRWNIYLHDTPAKSLFDREARAFSHGCIRLDEPFQFAYTLLAPQTDDPHGLFHSRLDTGRETRIPLERHVPVHLVYRTAFTTAKGELQFRDDVYGRDARILDALRAAGVALSQPES